MHGRLVPWLALQRMKLKSGGTENIKDGVQLLTPPPKIQEVCSFCHPEQKTID